MNLMILLDFFFIDFPAVKFVSPVLCIKCGVVYYASLLYFMYVPSKIFNMALILFSR